MQLGLVARVVGLLHNVKRPPLGAPSLGGSGTAAPVRHLQRPEDPLAAPIRRN